MQLDNDMYIMNSRIGHILSFKLQLYLICILFGKGEKHKRSFGGKDSTM